MSKKLRLLKVVVQPFFAVDDGESLEEQTSQPITVPASEWTDFPAKLEEQRKEAERELD